MIGYIYSKNNKINDVIKYEVGKRYSYKIFHEVVNIGRPAILWN